MSLEFVWGGRKWNIQFIIVYSVILMFIPDHFEHKSISRNIFSNAYTTYIYSVSKEEKGIKLIYLAINNTQLYS